MRATSAPGRLSPQTGHSSSHGHLLRAAISESDLRTSRLELEDDSPSAESTCRLPNATNIATPPRIGMYGISPKFSDPKAALQFITPEPTNFRWKTNLNSLSPDPVDKNWPTKRRLYMDTLHLSNSLNLSKAFVLGEEVQCRDEGDRLWMRGVIASIDPVVKVLPKGWNKAFAFDMVRARLEDGSPRVGNIRNRSVEISGANEADEVGQSMSERLATIKQLTTESTEIQRNLLEVEKEIGQLTVRVRLEGRPRIDFEARIKSASKKLASISEKVTASMPIQHSGCSILYRGLSDRCKVATSKLDELRDDIQIKLESTNKSFNWCQASEIGSEFATTPQKLQDSPQQGKRVTFSPRRHTVEDGLEVRLYGLEPQAEPSPCPTRQLEQRRGEDFGGSGCADFKYPEQIRVRELWQTEYVDKHVYVPEVVVEQRCVEVPQQMIVERAREVEVNEIVQLRRERAVERYRCVNRAVPRINFQPVDKFEEVPLRLKQEFVKEQPQFNRIEFVKEKADIFEEVRRKEVPRRVFDFSRKKELVPAITKKEQLVEVPRRETVELYKEVAVHVAEKIERPIAMPVCKVAEIIEPVDILAVNERIVYETPEKIVIEYIKEVPKIVTETIERKVAKPVYKYVEVIEEVPVVVYKEEIVEVPEIKPIQVIREVPVPVVKQMDRKIPNYEIRIQEKTVEYSVTLRNEVGIDVPEIRDVELVSWTPKVKVDEIAKMHPKVTIIPHEVYQEVPMRLLHEKPTRVNKTEGCTTITQLPVRMVQHRDKKVSKSVPVASERIDLIPVETSEEIVESVPSVQQVEIIQQELEQIVQEEMKPIPMVRMDYRPETVQVGYLDPATRLRSCGTSATNHVLQQQKKRLVNLHNSTNPQDTRWRSQSCISSRPRFSSMTRAPLENSRWRSESCRRSMRGDTGGIIHKRTLGGNWVPWVAANEDHSSASPARR